MGSLWSFVDSLRKLIRGESETAPENLTAARSLEGKDSDLQVGNMAASSSSSHEKYEVFLSFRGEDTRDGFTGHLYNALCQKHINTYKDDENLESGHKISEIMDAIKESKICIIVFSKDFASSTWCLDEVVRILECKRGGNDIIPIFYGIEPSIVRRQEKSYAVSFGKHEQRFKDNMDKVQHWRDALNEVGALRGYDSKNTRPEYKFIDEIVEDILSKLSRYPSTCDHSKQGLIGIENRIKEIEGLLCIDSMDVRTIGFYGMGGIGKTTLARAVFQKLSHHFENHCFLRNVREENEKHGIMELRKQLLSQLFYHDKTILSLESTHLQERLCRTKVLIVLDDLDDAVSQLNELLPKDYKLGAGSRIIVTTRDAQLVKSRTDKLYEVKRLNDVEALKLFHLHAFENNCDLQGYESLSKSVADYVDGNPLGLEVLGSSLHSKSLEEWKSALDELQIETHPKIEKVLRISFDQLGKKDKKGYTPIQDVFLDVACFHDDGIDRKYVESKIRQTGATKKISDLIDKCLIIEDRNRLYMHALIRQMGKAIVCDENKEPGKRSRIWKAKDVCHVLERDTGSCTMEGMLMDLSELRKDVKVRPTAFSNMYHLRFLRFFNDQFDFYDELKENLRQASYNRMDLHSKEFYDKFTKELGWAPYNKMYLPSEGIEYLSDELRYFQWDLYSSKYLPSNFSPENLVELVMRGSQLMELPWNEDQPLGNLKKIDLGYCEGLIQIQNLCGAINLEWIDLKGCTSLVQVPSWFKNLNKLKYLYLSYCENLKDGLENLPMNIRVLSLYGTAIEALPSSFGCLLNLEYLNLSYCEKLEDIQNISCSMGIIELDLDGTGIRTLPESICKMSSLTSLTLNDCPNLEKLQEISDDCRSSSLKELNTRGCTGLKSIPESIWKMSSLKRLTLDDCPNLEMLQEILDDCMSSSLEDLDITGCTRLKLIPKSIWKMSSLKILTLNNCPNLEKLQISDDCMSSSLEDLNISGCIRLKSIPESIWKMSSLKRLTLDDCPNLEKLQEISDDCMSSSLKVLDISGCTRLKSIPESIWKTRSLKRLTLSDCQNLEKLQEISNDCMSSSLEVLDISGCTILKSIPESIWKMSSLTSLTLNDCPNLEKLQEILDDYMSSSLKRLNINGCRGLKSIPKSIWKMSSLGRLTVKDCPNLKKVPDISDDCVSSSLEGLNISGCTKSKLNPIQNLCCAISFEGCTSLVQVPLVFKNLNKLELLHLAYCTNLKDGLENLPLNIKSLSLYGTAVEALPSSFGCLLDLTYLNLCYCKNLKDGMENLSPNLQTLYWVGCTRLKSIQVLPSGLNFLDASNCESLETISSWRDLQKIMDKHTRNHIITPDLHGAIQAVYPGNEIPEWFSFPEWFSHQTDDGNSLHIQLPPDWFPIHDPLFGFLFSVVFTLNGSVPYILFEINFKTNVNSDGRLHGHYLESYPLFSDKKEDVYRCKMERDHVFIGVVKLNLKDVFGEEWSLVCNNVTGVSFRVSIVDTVLDDEAIDWKIKKFGLGLANKRGTAK